ASITCRRITGTVGGVWRWPGRTSPGRYLPRIGDADGFAGRRERPTVEPPAPVPVAGRARATTVADSTPASEGVGCGRPRWTPTSIITRPPADRPAAPQDRPPRVGAHSGTILAIERSTVREREA